MALRRNIKHYSPTLSGTLLKWLGLLLLVLLLGVGGFILYFNGQHVKAPLLSLINEHSQVKFNAESVEFSPIYPNVLKLENISVDKKGRIEQLYLEYDLKSLLSGHILVVKELFAHGVTLPESTLLRLLNQTLGFAGINFEKIRVEDATVTLSPHLEASSLSFTLQDVDLKPGKSPEIQSGSLSMREGKIDGIAVKNLSCELRFLDDFINVSRLQAETLSGSVSGDFKISQDGKQIECDQLVLNNNVIKFPHPLLTDYKLNIPQGQIHNLVLVFGNDLLLSGLSGKLSDFMTDGRIFSGDLQGSIEEISLPQEQLTLEHNRLKFSRYDNFSSLRLSGHCLEGKITANLDFDEPHNKIKINELILDGQKIEAEEQSLERFSKLVSNLDIELINAELKNLEFLSKIKALPLSIKEISGSLKGFNWNKKTSFSGNPVGVIDLELQGLLYQDLGFRRLKLLSNLSKDLYSITLPEVRLNHGSFNLTASYSHLTHNSYLFAKAHDFDLSELNCSMIPHLLDGKLNIELDLRGSEEWQNFPAGLKGYVNLSGNNLLVSKFGLDLINGGPSHNYVLKGQELLDAMSIGDSGIAGFEFKSSWDGMQASFSSSFSLPVSQVNASGTVQLADLDLQAKAYFISGPKDAVTIVNSSGKLTAPEFTITAISRSEVRPGLYFNEEQTRTILNAELKAKEQQQALFKLFSQLKELALKLEKEQEDALQQILPYGEKSLLPAKQPSTQALPGLSNSELEKLEQAIFKNYASPR